MVDTRAVEDAPERAGVLEERRHQHEQRRVHEERLEALLDGEPRDHVDGAGEHEHRAATRARCAAGSGSGRPDAGEQRDQRDDAAEHGDDRREPRDADQVGGEEQRGQRDHVAGRGDDRRGHVVEVPVAPDAELRDAHRDRPSPRSTTGSRRSPRSPRSRRPRSCSRARTPPQIALARNASTSDTDSDIDIAAARFWPTSVSRRRRHAGRYRCGPRCRGGCRARRTRCRACRWRRARGRAGREGLRGCR